MLSSRIQYKLSSPTPGSGDPSNAHSGGGSALPPSDLPPRPGRPVGPRNQPGAASAPRTAELGGASRLAADTSPMPEVELVLLKDLGGVLVDESGRQQAFWVRVPSRGSGRKADQVKDIDVEMLSWSDRRDTNEAFREEGLVPHGWNIAYEVTKEGLPRLEPERLYVTPERVKVPTTDVTLPMKRNLLYETSGASTSTQPAPAEVESMRASVRLKNAPSDPESVLDVELGDISQLSKAGEVWTFELGNAYQMHFPPALPKNPVVIINAHGVEANNHSEPLEPGVTYTYLGPSNHDLVSTIADDIANERFYGQHAVVDGEPEVRRLSAQSYAVDDATITGTQQQGRMASMRLTKFGSLTKGDVSVADLRDQDTAREMAFMAHDEQAVVITIRKGQEGSPSDILESLKAIGIQPKEIRIVACRSEGVMVSDGEDSQRLTMQRVPTTVDRVHDAKDNSSDSHARPL
jgi:hypothetical protein